MEFLGLEADDDGDNFDVVKSINYRKKAKWNGHLEFYRHWTIPENCENFSSGLPIFDSVAAVNSLSKSPV